MPTIDPLSVQASAYVRHLDRTTGEALPGDRDPRFVAPAAPRSIFAGIRLLYD